MHRRALVVVPPSETPTQAAARAGSRWLLAQERAAEFLIACATPDFAQTLLGGVPEREAVVAAHRERSDAAGQCFAVRREIHEGPRAAAQRPGLLVPLLSEARTGLGRTRRVEGDAQRL